LSNHANAARFVIANIKTTRNAVDSFDMIRTSRFTSGSNSKTNSSWNNDIWVFTQLEVEFQFRKGEIKIRPSNKPEASFFLRPLISILDKKSISASQISSSSAYHSLTLRVLYRKTHPWYFAFPKISPSLRNVHHYRHMITNNNDICPHHMRGFKHLSKASKKLRLQKQVAACFGCVIYGKSLTIKVRRYQNISMIIGRVAIKSQPIH